MPKISKAEKEIISLFLEEHKLLTTMNKFLNDNNLKDFEVISVKLKRKEEMMCPPGTTKVEVCTLGGVCEYQCI